MRSDVFIKLDPEEWAELSAEQWMAATEYAHSQGQLYRWLQRHGHDEVARKVRDAFRQYLSAGEWGYSVEWAFISGEKATDGQLDRRVHAHQSVSKMQEGTHRVPTQRTPLVARKGLPESQVRLLSAQVEGVSLRDALQ